MPKIIQHLLVQILIKKPHYVYLLTQFALEKWPSIEPVLRKGVRLYTNYDGSRAAKP